MDAEAKVEIIARMFYGWGGPDRWEFVDMDSATGFLEAVRVAGFDRAEVGGVERGGYYVRLLAGPSESFVAEALS